MSDHAVSIVCLLVKTALLKVAIFPLIFARTIQVDLGLLALLKSITTLSVAFWIT